MSNGKKHAVQRIHFTSFVLKILGIGFPIASLNWPKRKLWMYLVPVAVLSVTVNIPEIYSAIAYFTGFPVSINCTSTTSNRVPTKIIL